MGDRSKIEHIGDATLYFGDCRDILPTLGKVDALVSDPPYGIGFVQRTTGATIVGDDTPFDPSHLWPSADEFLLWGAENFANLLPRGQWLVWIKRAVEIAAPKTYGDCELAWHSVAGCIKAHRQISDGCIREGEEHGVVRLHPSQKPVRLMQWCLGFVSGHTVLDPYMGSGTTGVACAHFGRKFTGIEIDLKYFDIACRRIDDAYSRPRLFREPKQTPEQIEAPL